MNMHTGFDSGTTPRYDAAIVGSGAAGLLAAHQLLQKRPASRVLVVDAGASLDTRSQSQASQLVGSGGAGLYLGGRLYLGPATIPMLPPVSAHPALQPILAGHAYAERAAEVNALLTRLGATAQVRPAPQGALAGCIAAAEAAGLEYITSYPARLLSAPERRAVLEHLLAALEQGGAVLTFGTRVDGAWRTADGFELALSEVTAESFT